MDKGNYSHAVSRDAWGIPCIEADNELSLAYGQGFCTAQDRAWQLSVERWRSEGRAAEHLGADEVNWDRLALDVDLDGLAQRCLARLDEPTQHWLGAYAEGIREALPNAIHRAPEFANLGHEARQEAATGWRTWSGIGVFLVQHLLFSTFPDKLWRRHVSQTLGPEAIRLFSMEGEARSGSNAWGVHGSRTASGFPLIAGDPHRLLELPGVYQQLRLRAPGIDVAGLAFPGVPGVQHFGHTGSAAWAITNAMADYQDLYEEEFLRDETTGQLIARGPSGPEPVTERTRWIKVRGESDVAHTSYATRRGPLVIGGATGGFSLASPVLREELIGFEALLPLLRARTVDDVQRALEHWVEPVNCVIAADTGGTLRRFVAGAVPRRSPAHRVLPVRAWEPGGAWVSSESGESYGSGEPRDGHSREVLPPAVAASADHPILVSANGREEGGGLGFVYSPPHRSQRIQALLQERISAGQMISAADLDEVLTDTLLLSAQRLLALIDEERLDEAPRHALLRIRRWDGRMDADSTEAGRFAAWRSALVSRLATGAALAPLSTQPSWVPDLYRPWLDPRTRIACALETIASSPAATGLELRAAATAAWADCCTEPARPWGETHRLHPVRTGPLDAITTDTGTDARRVPLSGDAETICSTSSTPGLSDLSARGSAARLRWDLSGHADSGWIVPFGASGSPHSLHFTDQLPRWASGKLAPLGPWPLTPATAPSKTAPPPRRQP